MPTPLFLIPILVGMITQFSKRFFPGNKIIEMDVHGIKLPRYGGMPSAHTAFAFSLATVIAVYDGIFGTTFVIAATVIIFILDDALRMRVFLSRHGQALHRLIKKLPPEDQKEFPHLETRLGHKPTEVTAGAAIGVILTLLIILAIGL